MSGLKINLSKSMFVGIGCSDKTISALVDTFKCSLGRLLFVYLGLTIGARPRSKSFWIPIIDIFK